MNLTDSKIICAPSPFTNTRHTRIYTTRKPQIFRPAARDVGRGRAAKGDKELVILRGLFQTTVAAAARNRPAPHSAQREFLCGGRLGFTARGSSVYIHIYIYAARMGEQIPIDLGRFTLSLYLTARNMYDAAVNFDASLIQSN